MSEAGDARGTVTRALRSAARRLAWRVALARAGWVALGAVLLVEVAAAAPLGSSLRVALLLAALAAGAAALTLLVRIPPIPAGLAAAVLDARLATGGLLAAAAEALAGGHARFGRPLVERAAAALSGVSLAAVLPVRPPPGLLAGAASAVLLPVLLSGGADAAEGPTGPRPISLLAPEAPGAGGAASDEAPPAPLEGALAPVLPGEGTPEADAAPDPLAALPLDEAEVLRALLDELARRLPTGGHGAEGDAGPASPQDAPADPLGDALARGDVAAAREALERLAEAATDGDRGAAARIEALAERVRAAGAGAGEGSPGAGTPEGAPAPAGSPTVGGRRAPLPWPLREASRRYFTVDLGR